MNIRRTLPAVLGLTVLAAGFCALPAFAGALVEGSDSPQVAADQVVDGSAYLAGNKVSVMGTVRGDLYCAGNSVTISGIVEGDVLCAGNNVTISGQVRGDIRVAGNNMHVDGDVAGSATMAGNLVLAGSGSTIGSDLTVGASTLDLAGAVGRDVRASAGVATLAGAIGRDVDGQIGTLTVEPSATIDGHLYYVSGTDGSIAKGTVAGEIKRSEPPTRQMSSPTFSAGQRAGQWVVGALVSTLLFVVLSVFVVFIMPRYVRSATETSWQGLLKAALVGLVTLTVSLPVVLVSFVSVIGAVVGVFLIVAYTLALLLAGPLAAYFVGKQILRSSVGNMFAIAPVGAAALGLAAAIPFVGVLIVFASTCAGVGLVVLSFRSQYRDHPYTDPRVAKSLLNSRDEARAEVDAHVPPAPANTGGGYEV
jgi:cytoskeletal protein CcmA (bactofilin family)